MFVIFSKDEVGEASLLDDKDEKDEKDNSMLESEVDGSPQMQDAKDDSREEDCECQCRNFYDFYEMSTLVILIFISS